MIDIEDAEQMPEIMGQLQQNLMKVMRQGESPGRTMLHQINNILLDLRQRCRLDGIEFPVMTAIILPSIKTLELVRADLDRIAIRQTVLNIIIKYPDVDTQEAAMAVKYAFPDYRPMG